MSKELEDILRTKNRLRLVTISLSILILLALIILIVDARENTRSCAMRFENTIGYPDSVQGVWYVDQNNEYMCVWMDADINDSIMHEQCHSYVYNDYNHFCDVRIKS